MFSYYYKFCTLSYKISSTYALPTFGQRVARKILNHLKFLESFPDKLRVVYDNCQHMASFLLVAMSSLKSWSSTLISCECVTRANKDVFKYTSCLVRNIEHCRGAPISLWGFQVKESALKYQSTLFLVET